MVKSPAPSAALTTGAFHLHFCPKMPYIAKSLFPLILSNQVMEGEKCGVVKMLSKEALEQFKKIWKQEFGEELSDNLALSHALNLLNFINIVFRPIKKVDLKKLKDIERNNSPNA